MERNGMERNGTEVIDAQYGHGRRIRDVLICQLIKVQRAHLASCTSHEDRTSPSRQYRATPSVLNILAPSYVPKATSEAGAVAALAEDRKKTKYTCLEPTYTFTPIAIETSGVFGPLTLQFLKDLGNRLRQATGDESSYTYLIQRLSVSVQRGNAASVLGTIGH